MPNLICTYNCNQNCSFCFAEKSNSGVNYNLGILEHQENFIKSFGYKSVNLIGGEPTQNREFIDILDWLINHDYAVTVFTNGIVEKKIIQKIQTLNLEKVNFCVNHSEPKKENELYFFFRSLGYLVQLSVTLFHQQHNLAHVIDAIKKYKLSKTFRIGIALPVYGTVNNLSLIPSEYKSASKEILDFIKECIKSEIKPSFDCGFPYCFFNDEQKSFLSENDIKFSSICGIIPDINANNEAVPCLPLNAFKFQFNCMDNWAGMEKRIHQKLEKQPKRHLFDTCNMCDEIEKGNCKGGCLALRLI